MMNKDDEAAALPKDQWWAHDEMYEALILLYPDAVAGQDYHIAHRVARGSADQLSSAFITYWNEDKLGPEPSLTDLMQKVEPHRDVAKRNFRARMARAQRDVALVQSDVQMIRAMETDDAGKKSAFKAYRQALRDVPT